MHTIYLRQYASMSFDCRYYSSSSFGRFCAGFLPILMVSAPPWVHWGLSGYCIQLLTDCHPEEAQQIVPRHPWQKVCIFVCVYMRPLNNLPIFFHFVYIAFFWPTSAFTFCCRAHNQRVGYSCRPQASKATFFRLLAHYFTCMANILLANTYCLNLK